MNLSVVYELADESSETVTVDRLIHIYHALSQLLFFGVPGAVVELGCYQGITSQFLRMIIEDFDPTRELHVYDSFRGLPTPGERDGKFRAGEFAVTQERVREGFRRRGLREPFLHAGWFEETLPASLPQQICFAYLDADLEAATATALSHVYTRLSPRGLLFVDDYCDRSRSPRCWDGLQGVRAAVDDFFRDKPERVNVLVGTGDLSLAAIRKL
jgi:O-methyltransferase